MKKRSVYALVGVIILFVVALGAWKGWSYYQDRYVGTTYYAVVPADSEVTLDNLVDASGKVAGKGHEYNLKAVNEKGETKDISFTVPADSLDELYQPGTYLKVNASKQLVVKQSPITEEEVPVAVLPLLQSQ